jgi:hypothetical protein
VPFAGSFDSIIVISYFSLVSYAIPYDAIHTINFCILVMHTIINANFAVIYIIVLFVFAATAPEWARASSLTSF